MKKLSSGRSKCHHKYFYIKKTEGDWITNRGEGDHETRAEGSRHREDAIYAAEFEDGRRGY